MTSRLALRTRPFGVVLTALTLFAAAGPARADTISFTGSTAGSTTATAANDVVSFSGVMDVRSTGTTSAVLTITLKNTTSSTSDAAKYGFITGFGFNVPTGIAAGSPTTTDADFKFLTPGTKVGSTTVATSLQGGSFDYAFSTSATQLHTVAAAEIPLGLGAGQSATFTAILTGTGAGSLTAAQLIKELSAPTAVPFSVRFRSTNPGSYAGDYQGTAPPDGDKVPVDLKSVKPVPAPPGVVLAGLGLGTLALGRFRRRAA